MEKKKGRPPGPRKDGQQVRMILASDVVAIADKHTPIYGSRTASVEALVRLGAGEISAPPALEEAMRS